MLDLKLLGLGAVGTPVVRGKGHVPKLRGRIKELNADFAFVLVLWTNIGNRTFASFARHDVPDFELLPGFHALSEQNHRPARIDYHRAGLFRKSAAIWMGASDEDGDCQHNAVATPLVQMFAGPGDG